MRIYLLLAMVLGGSFLGSNCSGSGIGDPCVPEDEYKTSFPGFDQGEVNVESRSFQCATRVCLVNQFRGRVTCPYGQEEITVDGEGTNVAECGNVPSTVSGVPFPITAKRTADCTADDLNLCNTCNPDAVQNCCPAEGIPGTACDLGCMPGAIKHSASCRVPDRDGSSLQDRVAVKVNPQYEERQADDAVYCSCRCADANGDSEGGNFCECPSGFSCRQLVDDLNLGKDQLAGGYCVRNGSEFDTTQPPSTDCELADANCAADTKAGLKLTPELFVPTPYLSGGTAKQPLERCVTGDLCATGEQLNPDTNQLEATTQPCETIALTVEWPGQTPYRVCPATSGKVGRVGMNPGNGGCSRAGTPCGEDVMCCTNLPVASTASEPTVAGTTTIGTVQSASCDEVGITVTDEDGQNLKVCPSF
ncbi:MAG: hypothetical protein MK135_04580 [Polyangiaceae bacterium]|nr:hypothetical protein [Polyangiaceae bacterium]